MTDIINPWLDMPESTKRRVKSETPHDLFWVKDLEGRYGFCLISKRPFDDVREPANLRGIRLLKRNSEHSHCGELFLILNEKEEWEIFYSLCSDLISITDSYSDDNAMIAAVETRLKRWQDLLKQDRNQAMTLAQQMGLFCELLCLRDIVLPKVGANQAITSWVGADFDKQDFLLDNAIIEVKGYKTSKGQTVHISSARQLVSDKTPLFLLTYGLTVTDNGESVLDVINDIQTCLKDQPNEIKNIFELKVLEYGYMQQVNKTMLYKFTADKNRVFLVADEFPKILPGQIKHGVLNVTYSIDLLECADYEQNINTFLNEEKQ